MEQTLLTIDVNGAEEIRLMRKEFRGKDYLDLRRYRGTGDDAAPTTKGFIADLETWADIAPAITAALA